ncbi:unnamed protein product [Brachionus calyciflorus]|uniref:Integrase p58-like C-terminal domain-containing protein n=1 Tax=Brachionus calyciflorus TaxID=104777 RepID=A0A814B7U0_9BILA|nr:unnamed protein product [Brachionus calyciflorus]
MFPTPELELNIDVHSYAKKTQAKLVRYYNIVASNTDSKVSKFKFYADRNVRRTSYILGDRVWLLNSTKKKGISKKLSRKWTGPFTVVEVRSENNYIIKPDKKGKRQLVHAHRLKKCFSPPLNVRYDSVIEYSQSQTKLDLNQTKNIEKPETDFVCLEPSQDKTMESKEMFYTNIENQNEIGDYMGGSVDLNDSEHDSMWVDDNFLDLQNQEDTECYAEDQHWVYQPIHLGNDIDRNAQIDPPPPPKQHPQQYPQQHPQQDPQQHPPQHPQQHPHQPQNQLNQAPQQLQQQHQQQAPNINIYRQFHLHVDANQLVNRLVGGRGRLTRRIEAPIPGEANQQTPPNPPIVEDFEVVTADAES